MLEASETRRGGEDGHSSKVVLSQVTAAVTVTPRIKFDFTLWPDLVACEYKPHEVVLAVPPTGEQRPKPHPAKLAGKHTQSPDSAHRLSS
ncbi:hypothetical protein PsYK624_110720 [Phanerochaete sordida]|uniref:Uncharacterized protein n=1 Tax=Phanerochaete sordida TaxID=48140 RepID=A0A9P3GH86_9APHY|nr:hypothetical protein PsYK624_110720 [Phanerochaete sordida]